MLDGAKKKKFVSLKILEEAGKNKLLQLDILYRAEIKNFLFTEHARQGWCKKAPLTQYVICGCNEKAQFIENSRRGLHRISFFYSIR